MILNAENFKIKVSTNSVSGEISPSWVADD